MAGTCDGKHTDGVPLILGPPTTQELQSPTEEAEGLCLWKLDRNEDDLVGANLLRYHQRIIIIIITPDPSENWTPHVGGQAIRSFCRA